jgi:tRNA threonylcarbamoyladenosine biosynthesis protein TsaE
VGDLVTSPTFSLVNEYEYEDETGNKSRFHHLDLYRLNDIQEALEIGIEDYLYDDNYCFIEWPELVAPLLPEDVVHIKITIMPDLSRKILLL